MAFLTYDPDRELVMECTTEEIVRVLDGNAEPVTENQDR